jgi:hypothetical protein
LVTTIDAMATLPIADYEVAYSEILRKPRFKDLIAFESKLYLKDEWKQLIWVMFGCSAWLYKSVIMRSSCWTELDHTRLLESICAMRGYPGSNAEELDLLEARANTSDWVNVIPDAARAYSTTYESSGVISHDSLRCRKMCEWAVTEGWIRSVVERRALLIMMHADTVLMKLLERGEGTAAMHLALTAESGKESEQCKKKRRLEEEKLGIWFG